jgi:hypothetical protein
LAEREQIHGKRKTKVCLASTGLLRKGSKQGMLGVDRAGDRRCQAILARSFSMENSGNEKRGKKKEMA